MYQFRVGHKVIFGRGNGEQSLGEIIKCNPTRAKVRLLESRGRGKGSEPGSTWAVPYEMMRAATEEESKLAVTVAAKKSVVYSTFQPVVEQTIMQAILGCYSELSPENLTCDGMLRQHAVRAKYADLQRKLKGLFAALGTVVSETEAYAWESARREAQRKTAQY